MTTDLFKYDDEQWLKLEAIVSRAGGGAAKEKFTAGRANFEKQLGGWKTRIACWDGHKVGSDDAGKYKQIERAARELGAALDDFNFPPIFSGNDLVWKSLDERSENDERFSRFLAAVEHIASRAAKMAEPRPKRIKYVRDLFFAALMRTWRDDLGLSMRINVNSALVAFIEVAASRVYEFPRKITAKETISNVIRRWKPGIERE